MKSSMIAGLGLALALVVTPAAGPARAAEPEVDAASRDDMRCMALFALMGADDQYAESAAIGMVYFIGRLHGRSPDADWMARFRRFMDTVDQAEILAHAPVCAETMKTMGAEMIAFGAGGEASPAPRED